MGIGFLSQRLTTVTRVEVEVPFGSVEYEDPRVVSALSTGGLKEPATERGQIVTGLKMAWWLLLAPFWLPAWVCRKILVAICSLVMVFYRWCARVDQRIRAVVRSVVEVCQDVAIICRASFNYRMRALIVLLAVVFVSLFGLLGLLVWSGSVAGWVCCYLPTDFKYYLKFLRKLEDAWTKSLECPELEDQKSVPLVKKERNTFACRLATRAISRVGLLKPTKANALVYQKVILDEMRELNVRYADRLRVLPVAIAACLERPEEVQSVERCIEHLCSASANL
ncbi:p32 [Rice virus A]|nr:p32 [Rice virus A]ASM46795.1 p32 [Rice virus A]